MWRSGKWVILGVLLLAATSGFAQITGSIQGEVTDSEGLALPGATVKLTGDPLPGAERLTTTDAKGAFRYGSLPVGRYSVSASVPSFRPQQVSDVRVSIDAVAVVKIRMSLQAVTESMTVTASAPLLDTVSSSVASNYEAEFVKALPTRNNFYDIVSVAPAVSAPNEGNSLLSAYGGNVTSQQWNIDGLNLASPEGGWLGWSINPEIVQETSLKGFGAGAEYGSTMGNVYNMVTKSGTNAYHGSLGGYWTNNALVDPNIKLDSSKLYSYRLWNPAGEYTIDDYYDARATLGGPILQDKLWFFAAGQWDKNNIVGPNGVAGLDGSGTTDNRYDGKLGWQIADGHHLDVRGQKANTKMVPAPDMYTALSAVIKYDIDIDMITGDYVGTLGPSTLLNVRGGYWSKNQDMSSRTGSTEEWLQDATYPGPPLNLGGIFWFNGRKEKYTQADAVLSHFASDFIKGSHEIKFGIQYNEGSGERRAAKSSFMWKQPASPGFTDPYWAFRYQIVPPLIYGADTTTKSAFLTDSWKITNRLTVDLGVRYDDQRGEIPSYPRLDLNGNPTSEMLPSADMIHWKNWAPRLGIAWQPTSDGRSVARAFYGRYWDGPVSSAWYYPPPGRGNSEVWFVYPWQFRVSSVAAPAPDKLLAPGVKNPYTDQFGVSYDHQIGRDVAVGAQFVYKHTDNMIGWQIEADGVCKQFLWDDPWTTNVKEQIPLCEVTKDPTLHKGNAPGHGSLAPDDTYHLYYRGLVLTFKKRYSHGWDLMASYTYSKTEGINPRPHDNGALGQGLPSFSTDSGSDPNDWYNAYHSAQGDRPHMFRVQSNVDVGWGLRASGVFNWQSGRPYLRLAQIVGPTTGTAITVTADASENLRLPSQAILDLALQKTFKLGAGVTLDLGLQLLNALNEDAVEYYSTWTLYPGQNFEPASWVSPRRLQIRAQIAF
jgi:hypothetical protein